MSDKVIAYKGFNTDWTCRGFQYAIGKTYEHEGPVETCGSGFHACEHPLNVFDYYVPAKSKFALVELDGDLAREDGGDTKVAAAKITIKAELQLSQLVEAAVEHVFEAAKWLEKSTATKDNHAASATGGRGAASATGYQGAASATGDQGAASATGYRGAASATGYQGAASATGDRGAASATDDRGAASATGGRGAASATGQWGAASATGYQGAASATGGRGAAMASGFKGRVLGEDGCALFLCERDANGEILNVWAGVAGRDGIKADTWYVLENGTPVEMSQ
ncbi:DUF7666 domain-containing protein [Tateyamaria sp.]|uniref:DUF7666 domain-containing protein n=1 Tax=Tateyamaria sp. TaxID=1929288 RepID=UPI003B20CAA9